MFRLADQHGRKMVLAPTHEEAIPQTGLDANSLRIVLALSCLFLTVHV